VSEIFWIEGQPPPGLAVVACPHGDKLLKDEMHRLRRGGIDTLVSLLEAHEAGWLGLAKERSSAENAGLEFLSYPIRDTTVPTSLVDFRAFVADLAERLRGGQRIGVHCRGSIGRATVTAACTLIHLGWKAEGALAAVEAARGLSVPDTEEQRVWILVYEAEP
jgi:protein-tyrosine phosphatase